MRSQQTQQEHANLTHRGPRKPRESNPRQVAALTNLFHCIFCRVNHSNNAIVKPPEMTPQAAAKELESVMRRVREAQSTIAAAIEPGTPGALPYALLLLIETLTLLLVQPKADTRKRSSSRSRRSRRSRSRSHSRSRTRRKRSRSKHRCRRSDWF